MSDATTPPEEQNDDNWLVRKWDEAADVVVASVEKLEEEAAEVKEAYDEGGITGAAGAVVASSIDVYETVKNSEVVEKAKQAVDDLIITAEEEAEMMEMIHKSRLKEQCLLMYHFNQLQQLHRATTSPVPFTGHQKFPQYIYKKTELLDGHGLEVMPKLTMKPGSERLLSATSAELSNLIPMIKINKIVYDENNEVIEIPFKFYNHTITHSDALNDWGDKKEASEQWWGMDGWQARSAVGIKSFDWSYKSGNAFAAERDIDAKLVLYFQSMDELVRNRVDPATGLQYRYLDLIVHPPKSMKGSSLSSDSTESAAANASPGLLKEYDSSFYEIKAVAGWAPLEASGKEIDEEFARSIRYNKQAIFLGYTNHTFSIGQDGTFELTIDYKSRLEGVTESPKSNILFCDKDILSSPSFNLLIGYEKEILGLSEGPCADNREAAEEKKRSLQRIQKQLKEETYKKIIENLLDPARWYGENITDSEGAPQRLIYSLFMTQADIGTFAETATMPEGKENLDYENISTSELKFKGPAGPTRDNKENITYDPSQPEETLVNFFFLGDLLDMLFYTVFDTEKYENLDPSIRKKYSFNRSEVENFKLLLGPMEFKNAQAPHNLIITNIADIPISLRAFTEFFHRKVIVMDKTVYPFKTFVKDLLTELVQVSLGESCFGGLDKPAMAMRDAYVSGPRPNFSEKEEFRHELSEYGYTNPLFDKESHEDPVDEQDHFMVIHMQKNGNLYYPGARGEDLNGRTPGQVDRDRGIPHMHIGRDRGLLTNASFQKASTVTNLREARVEALGAFNPLNQLADVYEVDIEMIGNVNFYPGSYVYLNPFGLGSGLGQTYIPGTLSNIMGLGGYHLTTSTTNYIESGKFKTTVHALWETGGNEARTSTVNSEDAAGDCADAEPEESE